MPEIYKIYGAEMSPYSVKVRSYFRYKKIPHKWQPVNSKNHSEYRARVRLPLIPVVITPENEALQDSTPIIERMESLFPEFSVSPQDPVLAFLSALLEDYGDEWGNKLMFHYRWWNDVDQIAASWVLARSRAPDETDAGIEKLAQEVRKRMAGRRYVVGSDVQTAPLIAGYFRNLIDILEKHLSSRLYLFGNRPSLADFGLALQLYECALDPGCGAILRASYERTLAWCFRMLEPRVEGDFETWVDLQPSLSPLLVDAGQYFLPWSNANAEALISGEPEFEVRLGADQYKQQVQKYHAKSLGVLRNKYATVADNNVLGKILQETGCRQWLQ